MSMLEGARQTIDANKLRFLFLSTHHHTISGDALTHQRCLEFLRDRDAHVIVQHNVTESYSGDGLIAASFDSRDKHIPSVHISRNHPSNSLFRELEYDLDEAHRELKAIRESYSGKAHALAQRLKQKVMRVVGKKEPT